MHLPLFVATRCANTHNMRGLLAKATPELIWAPLWYRQQRVQGHSRYVAPLNSDLQAAANGSYSLNSFPWNGMD